LISGTIVEKLCPKPKTNHESPKRTQYDLPDLQDRRKHEKRIMVKGCFVFSFFRVFVIKIKTRHNSTAKKYETKFPISNFNVP